MATSVFAKYVDKEGRVSLMQHRCHDPELFKSRRHGEQKDGASVTFLSKEQYEAETGRKVWTL
jgi:hypothetical protein